MVGMGFGITASPFPPASLGRAITALAVATNTTPSQWLAESDEAILTAIELVREQNKPQRDREEEYDGE